MPEVLILTGPPAAGKSTVAQALAERYDRVAHVRVDALRHFVTPTGYVHPWGPPAAWQRQQRLAIRNACALALNFLEERFAVIVDDIVTTREEVDLYLGALEPAGVRVHLVRLLPRLDVCKERNRVRAGERIPERRLEAVYERFVAAGEAGGVMIDNSELSSYATADKVQALTTSGASLVGASLGNP
jgi:tRNA uridine 5-carbamoylmethylation protein Kti12